MRMLVKSSVLVLAISAASAAFGQAPSSSTDSTQAQHRPHGQFQHRGPNPEFETKILTKRLSLTPDQVAQVEPILAERQERMKALRPADGTKPDFRAMREQMKSIMDDSKQRLDAVLTPEQKQQFATMHDGEHRGHGPHGPKPTAAPAD